MGFPSSRSPFVAVKSRRVLALAVTLLSSFAVNAAEWRFEFGAAEARPGFTQVSSETGYDAARGFGFLENAAKIAGSPSVFAVDVAEGNYDVTIHFGDPVKATSTTIKTESRRLVIENVETAPGQYEARSFTVNVRRPAISTGDVTALNSREKGPPAVPDWDDHLTFEFNGRNPGVAAMEIKPATAAITVFLAGDSTVTDQAREPYAGWGQMLPRFFKQGVAVSNQAESGLALSSFERQKRLAKILSMMKEGDYLFIQFGHNDQKSKEAGAGPFTSYQADLKRYVDAVRSNGGIPVLVTPTERRRWNGNEPKPTLADFAEAVRQLGAKESVPVVDLNTMSLAFYSALGPEKSKKAFVHYPASTFPGQDKPLEDDSHHSAYGGYELARCVVEGIKAHVPALASRLAADTKAFDPAKPDEPEKICIPASPSGSPIQKPAGN